MSDPVGDLEPVLRRIPLRGDAGLSCRGGSRSGRPEIETLKVELKIAFQVQNGYP